MPYATLAILPLLLASIRTGEGSAAAAEPAPLIAREVLFGNPDRSALRVSPDASRLGWLAPHNGVLNIWIQELENGERRGDPRPVTDSSLRPIRQWEFLPGTDQVIYLMDDDGDEDFRLYVADIEVPATDQSGQVPNAGAATEKQACHGRARCLTPWDETRSKILAVDHRHPGQVLIANNRRERSNFDVLRIEVATGAAVEVYRNELAWFDMLSDGDWNVRVVRRFLANGGSEALYRPTPTGSWQPFRTWSADDAGPSKPLGVSADGRVVYVSDCTMNETSLSDTGGLFEVSMDEAGAQTWRLLANDLQSEPRGLLSDPVTGRAQAVSFEYGRARWRPVDESIARDLLLLGTIGDGVIEITSRSVDGRLWTVQHNDARTGVTHWLYHRHGEGGRTERLFPSSDAIAALRLRPMDATEITARDGLQLLAYLTVPEGFVRGTSKPGPMVLHVHGGPWTRDSWGFNPLHQWLANRGYSVLSVNFRGSTGFGKRFMNAGDRQWSKAMHDDLVDAVQWAIREGIADPSKVAIMGQSYGGYATLVGLTFTPTLFACGVDIVGPANLRSLLSSIPAYWAAERGMLDRRVGRLDEGEWLDSISPLSRIGQLQRPLLIGQGANDPRVPRFESDQIVQAAQTRAVPVAYVVFPDEGHGFARPENRMAFMAITEAFLAKQLGGRAEPIGDDLKRSSGRIEAGESLIRSLGQSLDTEPGR
ncbi:MAG: S9 family peptidase [Phycisphaerae bacterium]|nr:S9 family peptidase [Phycisphaerae bacterium]